MQSKLMELGCKKRLTVQGTNSQKAFEAFMRLHEPEIIEATETIGWSPESQAFRFPNYAVSYSGVESSDNKMMTVKADGFEVGTQLSPDEFDTLTEPTATNVLGWQLVASVMINALRAVNNLQLIDTVVATCDSKNLGRLCRAIGCPSVAKEHVQHNWSMHTIDRSIINESLDDRDSALHGLIYRGTKSVADYSLVRGDSNVIWFEGSTHLTNADLELWAMVIPGFLRYLGETKKLDSIEISTKGVIDSLVSWIASLRGDGKLVRKAIKAMSAFDEPSGHSCVIGEALAASMSVGRIRAVPTDYWTDPARELVVQSDKIFLSEEICRSFVKLSNEMLKWSFKEIELQLKKSGELVEMGPFNKVPGWWMSSRWYKRYLKIATPTVEQKLKS
jgi:hypothetical protein